ncbi:hypothetical protein Tco_1493252 [Tanacetum coccineum]
MFSTSYRFCLLLDFSSQISYPTPSPHHEATISIYFTLPCDIADRSLSDATLILYINLIRRTRYSEGNFLPDRRRRQLSLPCLLHVMTMIRTQAMNNHLKLLMIFQRLLAVDGLTWSSRLCGSQACYAPLEVLVQRVGGVTLMIGGDRKLGTGLFYRRVVSGRYILMMSSDAVVESRLNKALAKYKSNCVLMSYEASTESDSSLQGIVRADGDVLRLLVRAKACITFETQHVLGWECRRLLGSGIFCVIMYLRAMYVSISMLCDQHCKLHVLEEYVGLAVQWRSGTQKISSARELYNIKYRRWSASDIEAICEQAAGYSREGRFAMRIFTKWSRDKMASDFMGLSIVHRFSIVQCVFRLGMVSSSRGRTGGDHTTEKVD